MAGGVGSTSVRHDLSSGGPVSPSFWCGDLGFSRGNVQESIGGSRGFPTKDNKPEGSATEGRDMEAGGSRDGP